ncbi:hypothetical protein C6P42_001358, partial [Pichia californica]
PQAQTQAHQQQIQQSQSQPQLQQPSQLPSLKNVPGISNVMYNNNNNNNTATVNNNINSINNNFEDSKHTNSDVSLFNINGNNQHQHHHHHRHQHNILQEENDKLRTRINELELVNDLYKTRIGELEEMDVKFQKIEADYRRQIRELEYSLQQHTQAHIKNISLVQPKIENNENNLKIGEKRQSKSTSNNTNDGHIEKRIKVEN